MKEESLSPEDLRDLENRFAQGDRAAFDTLYRLNGRWLFRMLNGVLANREEAEDALQETFVAAWTSHQSYSPAGAGRFGTWLREIACNKAIDRLRASGTYREKLLKVFEWWVRPRTRAKLEEQPAWPVSGSSRAPMPPVVCPLERAGGDRHADKTPATIKPDLPRPPSAAEYLRMLGLGPRERAVYEARETASDGITDKQIADTLGYELNAFKVALSRARAKVKAARDPASSPSPADGE